MTKFVTSLTEVEARFSLCRSEDLAFFAEWQGALPDVGAQNRTSLSALYRRLQYHCADGELSDGAVTLLVASLLLELASLYDPSYTLKPEASVEIFIDDDEEILRGRIDVLILQDQFWVLVLESKKRPFRFVSPCRSF